MARYWCGLVAILVLALAADSAGDNTNTPWWKSALFYQVYPRSFKDSDGDGVGDLKGITQMADYFKEIGVDAIWLSPINTSPMVDMGYDISDYKAIDPTFGTMGDFDELTAKMRSIGVKLILDFVPNHTSDEHPWFQHSLNPNSSLHKEYADFYVWRDPKYLPDGTRVPPNNWMSLFSGSAWTYREERKQYYLHKFVPKQPDLNYWNLNVQNNMTSVIEFWLDKGVDGFRMDAVAQMFEDQSFSDEPAVPGTSGSTWADLDHVYSMNQPGTYDMLRHWADVVYNRVQLDGRDRMIMLEVYDKIVEVMKYYGSGNTSLEFPFNFELLTQGSHATRPGDIKEVIDDWMKAMPKGGVANWVVGNHDNERVSNRYGPELVDAINLLTAMLPGIKVTYYGAEIGMKNTFVRWDQTADTSALPLGPYHYLELTRDPERTPMQWDDSPNAGFSTNSSTWLPVNPNFWHLNVQDQRERPNSHMKVFQAMAKFRKTPLMTLGGGNTFVPKDDDDTLVITRSYNGESAVLIVNMGSKNINYTSDNFFRPYNLDVNMTVVTASVQTPYLPGMNFVGGHINVTLRPKACVLLRSGYTPGQETTPSPASTTPAPHSAAAPSAPFAILALLLGLALSTLAR